MKLEEWLGYEKTFSRGELLKLCWLCSIPVAGWITLGVAMIMRGHNENGRWKKKN